MTVQQVAFPIACLPLDSMKCGLFLCPPPSLLPGTVACVGHDGGECLHGEPDLARVMETERDPEKLLRVWARWRDAAGAGEK